MPQQNKACSIQKENPARPIAGGSFGVFSHCGLEKLDQ